MNAIRHELDDYDRAILEDGARDLEPAPVPAVDEPAMLHGARVLRYLIRTGAYGLCSDLQLELAEHAACYTVALARPADEHGPIARVRDVWRSILAVLKDRQTSQPADELTSTPAGRPNVGPMAPLASVPLSRPPAGQHAGSDGIRF